VTLLRLAHDEHIMLLGQHHIVTDGWSVKVLIDELRRPLLRTRQRPTGRDAA